MHKKVQEIKYNQKKEERKKKEKEKKHTIIPRIPSRNQRVLNITPRLRRDILRLGPVQGELACRRGVGGEIGIGRCGAGVVVGDVKVVLGGVCCVDGFQVEGTRGLRGWCWSGRDGECCGEAEGEEGGEEVHSDGLLAGCLAVW